MEIEEFTPDDSAVVAECVAVQNAAEQVDSPWVHPTTVSGYTGILRYGWDGEAPRCFVIRDGGRTVGHASYWTSEWDNTDLAWCDVTVAPASRRAGAGSALLVHLVELARSEGRTKVGTDGWEAPSTRSFAEAHGFEKKSQGINRRQYLADVEPGIVEKLHDEAVGLATGYDLVRIETPTPDAMMDEVAVMTAAINDAPLDDLDIEDEVFPPERIRAFERVCLARGHRLYRLAARHRATGELVGQTVVTVEGERPSIGHQNDTSVVRGHRGHRLGLLLKTGMLQWLAEAEPQLETLDTWNAESNEHMIGVNELLGYRALGRGLQFQRRL
jgi:GNAT superfamily N-acetyltransferase